MKFNVNLTSCYNAVIAMVLSTTCFAQTIVISPNTVISHSKTYDNVTLDMSNGSFIIKDNAILTIRNSIINGTLSKNIPVLINADKGVLNLKNNHVKIATNGLSPHPTTQSLQHVIQLAMAGLTMDHNTFVIDKAFTAGLLITTASIPTANIKILDNKIEHFHGVAYLIGTDNALISGNTLNKNTYGNLLVIGSNSKIINHTISYSGNNRLGNSIDVIDSNNITVNGNLILTPTCHGIYIFNSRDVVIEDNYINGGITYAMNILTFPETLQTNQYINTLIQGMHLTNRMSSNITVSHNLLSQNRYGIAGSDIDGLNVTHNIFIQRFEDDAARTFWTNNNVLLQNVTQVNWEHNLYKEAYTQEENGSTSRTDHFVQFPATGGVM